MFQIDTGATLNVQLKKLALSLITTSALLVAVSTQTAHAQVPTDAAAISDPSRATEQFRTPDVDFKVGPSIEVKEANVEKAPAGAENIKLTLKKIDISGSSIFTADYLQSFYEDKLNTEISLADVYSIAARLTKLYRDYDYAISRVVVPVQTIDKKSGTIKLEAVEGFVDNIRIEGDKKANELERIRGYVSKIQGVRPLDFKELERVLLMINDLPGVEARAVLDRSNTTAKATDLTLIVRRNRVDGLVSFNNHGSRYLGHSQLIGATSFNSWLGLNERVTFQGAYAPGRHLDPELAYASGYFEVPVNRHGTWFKAFLSQTETKPGYDLKEFDVEGNSTYGEFKFVHPIIRTRNFNWFADAAFDWRDVDSKNNVEPTRKDRIRAVRLGTNFEFLDTLFRAGVNTFSFKVSRGLDFFGASETGATNLSRELGDPEFTKFEAEFQRLQRLTNKWNILAAVKGQMSNNALLSSEEFGVGGVNIGRGFDGSEIIGDEGISGKVEVQWRTPYHVPIFDSYQLYGFYDIGRVWNDDATTNDLKRESLASAGIGLDAKIAEKTKLGFMVAKPLTRDVQTQGDDGARVYFSLSREF
ncbi:MAG: BamA/TamA family outer membrane protein [Alphaproteobacteria bacterium]|nr:BamA/TamA family outer membrane protein [Alphaproteobacteria bacterium]